MQTKNKEENRFAHFIRRHGWTLLSGILAACLVTAAVFAIVAGTSLNQARVMLNNSYGNAFNNVGDHLHKINTELIKMRVCTSPSQQSALLYTIWREAGQAQSGLSGLPVDQQSGNALLQFVNRLGDYCFTLARRVEQGAQITDEEYQTLRTLEKQAADVAVQIEQLRDSGVDWEQAQTAWNQGGETPILDGIGQVSQSISEYPALIYDGPYSERAENIEPKAAAGETVSYEQAVKVAERFVQGTYTRNEDQGAQVPTYCMTCTRDDGVQFDVCVTKKSGLIYTILPAAAKATDIYPTEDQVPALVQTAKTYLEDRGFPSMQSAYAQFYAGSAVINMVPVENDIILYPDLVKVWVDVTTKEVLGLDAHNYTVSHVQREFPQELYDEETLTQRVAQRLTIDNVRLAVIPYNATQEKLCYEFTGTNADDTFAIYINAVTGEEMDIKLIVDADDGTFTY